MTTNIRIFLKLYKNEQLPYITICILEMNLFIHQFGCHTWVNQKL